MKDIVPVLLLIGLGVLLLWLYFKFFKLLKLRNIVFVDGTLGSGKTFLCVSLAIRLWKREHRRWRIKKFLLRYLSFSERFKYALNKLEEPLLYTNILLRNVPYVKVSKDLLTRKNVRFAYKSVVLLDDFSLMADQMTFKDRELNERLSEFFKLFRHETRGGWLVTNSQSISDLHYSLRYVLSDYVYIHHKTRFPFVSALKVQEMAYTADSGGGTIVNSRTEDIENTMKCLLVFNHRYYDTYCFSVFTDMLPVKSDRKQLTNKDSLKDPDFVSWKQYTYLFENLKGDDEK